MAGSPKSANELVQSEVHGEAAPVSTMLACSSSAQAAAPARVAGLGMNDVPENFPFAFRLAGVMSAKVIVPTSTAFPETRSSLWSMSRLKVPETVVLPSVPAIIPLTPLLVQLIVALSYVVTMTMEGDVWESVLTMESALPKGLK